MDERTYGIFAARFQPYHNGHHRLIERYLEVHDAPLLLAIVASYVPTSLLGSDPFSAVSADHHLPARNPLDVWTRVGMLSDVWAQEIAQGQITVLAIPRPQGPDAWWRLVTSFLPPRRFWIAKWTDEPFEAAKMSFFEDAGEQTLKLSPVDLSDCKRGFELREMISRGECIAKFVPKPIADRLRYDE